MVSGDKSRVPALRVIKFDIGRRGVSIIIGVRSLWELCSLTCSYSTSTPLCVSLFSLRSEVLISWRDMAKPGLTKKKTTDAAATRVAKVAQEQW